MVPLAKLSLAGAHSQSSSSRGREATMICVRHHDSRLREPRSSSAIAGALLLSTKVEKNRAF